MTVRRGRARPAARFAPRPAAWTTARTAATAALVAALVLAFVAVRTHPWSRDRATPVAAGSTTSARAVATGPAGKGGYAPAPPGPYPAAPPVRVCDNPALLDGPASPPPGALVVPAGDNSALAVPWNRPSFSTEGVTYWFAPGVHTLGTGQYAQIVPGRGASFVGAPGAVLDGQGRNDYAFGGAATGVAVRHLTVRNFSSPTSEGVVNHDPGANWVVEFTTISGNGGAGLVLGTGNRASYNCLKDNSQYGFIAKGADGTGYDVVLDHNEITGNNTGDWETKNPGCGCTGGGKFWDVRGARVTNNYVHGNKGVGIWADTDNADFRIEGNWIEDNDGQGIMYEISYNALIRGNVLRHNLLKVGAERIARGEAWPDAAIYISESGGDARVRYTSVGAPVIDISGNLVQDNFNGVTLWEGSNRFCNSPANTSTGYCTLVRPGVVTLAACAAPRIGTEPYYSDCRWKTQNVVVHDNVFVMTMANFAGCSARFCGRNALLSDWGTYPDWSPYTGGGIGQQVTFRQGNVFRHNTYVGDWSFVAVNSDTHLGAGIWQAAPYRQDAGSVFR